MGRENPVIAQPSSVISISEPPEPLKTTTSTKSTAFRQFTPVTEFVFTQSFHSITSGRKFALKISFLERRWLQTRVGEIMSRHGGSIGTSHAWGFQMLGADPQKSNA